MKILFIAPYRQNDGWGLAAKDYAKALYATKHHIAIRPIYMGSSVDDNPDELLLQMEKTSFTEYDLVIQKVLPHLFEKTKVPTIGLFTLETGELKRCPWYDHMSIMDGILVPSEFEKSTIEESGLKTPVWAISEPVDTSVYTTEWGHLETIPKDGFNFYFVGEFIPRKNLDALIKAFHVEFHRSEPVNLIIKTNRSGMDSYSLAEMVHNHINDIKRRMRIYDRPELYKSELIITGRLTEEDMCKLHCSCNCFVMPSRGEAFCRPAVDAMGFGNTPIVTANTGMTDYIDESVGWVIPSIKAPVDSAVYPLPSLYTGRETWSEIDILELGKAMRMAYAFHHPTKRILGREKALYNFSYPSIGKKMEEALDEFDTGI